MASAKASIEEQIIKWESTRKKGRKSYIIKSWVVPFGIILPAVMILSASLFSSNQDISIKHWGIFIAVFEPLFIGFTVFAGFSSWKYWEQRYERYNNEKHGGPTNLPGTKVFFSKYSQLIIGIYSIPIFLVNLMAFFLVAALGNKVEIFSHNSSSIFSILFLIFILSFLPILNVMAFVKNPICSHGILSNPDHLHRHPNAKGNYWVNAWKIIRGKPFICLDCADEYSFEKSDQLIEIIKIEKAI